MSKGLSGHPPIKPGQALPQQGEEKKYTLEPKPF
jgi:hypothetical protein